MEGLEERAAKARERRQFLDDLSRRLIEPCTSSDWLADQAGRVRTAIANTQQNAPFAFDESGNPIESLRPLIENEVARQSEIWADRTADANELMNDNEFFGLAQKLLAESYIVIGYVSNSENEPQELYNGNDYEEAKAAVNNPIGPCVRKYLFVLGKPDSVKHFEH